MNKNNGNSSNTKAQGNALASVYAVTGYNNNGKEWNDYLNGTASASTTGNIYGIYDLSGGTWERTAAYIANRNGNLDLGNSFTKDSKGNLITTSTKYATVYPYEIDPETNKEYSDYTVASQKNWEKNRDETQIYGDAVRETSQKGKDRNDDNFYYGDYSWFPSLHVPFFIRGGYWWGGTGAGLFYFYRYSGNSDSHNGFRAVLV